MWVVIVSLEGGLILRMPLSCVLEAHGIGYEIFVPLTISLPPIGEVVKLWIYAIYREDSQSLYGFNSMEERDFFKLVVEKVSGIGPKTALAMLSKFRLSELNHSIAGKDTSLLASIPGIGKKTAEKIILELSDKINNFGKISTAGGILEGIRGDAILGLIALGYKKSEAEGMVSGIMQENPHITVEQLIRRAIAIPP
jgi:Holliday junction DNA helicase RuvA